MRQEVVSRAPYSSLIGAVFVVAGVLGMLALAPPALGEAGRISGRVLGGPEAAVLADTRVELHRFDTGTGGWPSHAVTRTDAEGRYSFTVLAAGRYRLCADSDAGIGAPNAERLYLPRCWRTAPTVESADEVVLDSASMTAAATIRLQRRGQIRGHVTGPEGAAVTGGYAQVFWNESGRWVPGPYAIFNDEGNYELRVSAARVYHVCFYPWEGQGLANQCWNGAPALPGSTGFRAGQPNGVVAGIDAQLDRAGRIEGAITGYPTGTQGSIEILAIRKEAGEWWTAGWNLIEPWTSPNPFEINNLPAGNYRVCFNSQDFEFFPVFASECVGGSPTPDTGSDIEVAAGETTTGADVDLGSASTIRGRALGIDAPVPVQLLTASGEPIFERLTAADGTYGFSGLPNGSYRVAFNRVSRETRLTARYYRNRPEQLGIGSATPVELGNGELLTGISTTLTNGGSITGRVVDRDGAGIAGCQLRAYTPSGSLVTRWSTTDANGLFDVGGLSTGSYRLLVGGGTCGISRADLHYASGTPARLTRDASLADTLAVIVGTPTAVSGDLIVTELRNLTPPSVTGTARVGQPLIADPGTWSPVEITASYKWFADGAAVPGAAGPSFTPIASQVGSRIRVRVVASKAGYPNAVRISRATSPVAP